MTQNESNCSFCRRSSAKANLVCDLCQASACKECIEFVPEDSFSFLETVPPELSHRRYCPACVIAHIEPAREAYQATMEKAKEAYYFSNLWRKPLPMIRKAKEKVTISACADRDETILRLAFLAVSRGYNSIIQGEVTSQKVRNEGWQTSRWQGTGIPADLDIERLERHSRWNSES